MFFDSGFTWYAMSCALLLKLLASWVLLADCQCLFQVRSHSRKTHALTMPSPSALSSQALVDIQNLALDLKFFMPASISECEANTSDTDGSVPSFLDALSVDTEDGVLAPVRTWLWANDERRVDSYIRRRLACSSSLVGSPEEADFCYPSCDAYESLYLTKPKKRHSTKPKEKNQWMMTFCFEIPVARRFSWGNCAAVCFRPEAYTECQIEVPYLHGISWPSIYSNAPWEFDFARTVMLVYFGGVARGHDREETLQMIQAAASDMNDVSPESIFVSHLVEEDGNNISGQFTPPFYRTAWELYASANFSWHPHGDTPTRRAVYDSLMFGCVPVIEETASIIYSRLFNGLLWSESNIQIQDAFVIIPAGMEQDGTGIVKLLASISASEIEQRRRNLAKIAPVLQWGWNGPSDAFRMAMGSYLSAVPKPLENAADLLHFPA
mmetsp:Transcript_146456/g.255415  ORF Transcript_146456/g.255415 Transcript_146456/m.255415 type:complete len:438 (-) Transcript_146456:107-1420(-)